jgi:hypothetical protein
MGPGEGFGPDRMGPADGFGPGGMGQRGGHGPGGRGGQVEGDEPGTSASSAAVTSWQV